jgi:Flp pilus assembly protein TadG
MHAWGATVSAGLRNDRERGAAAVEFALVSVLLFTLLFGIVQYGYYFFQSTSAEAGAREGARLAAVGVTNCASWRAEVVNRSGSASPTAADITLSYSPSQTVGAEITVRIPWERQNFGFPFVPFLGSGTTTEVAKTRAEYLGSVSASS